MSGEDDAGRRKSAREEFEEARERYYALRQQERDLAQRERDAQQQERQHEREAHREERQRARSERRAWGDEVRRSMRADLGENISKHIGRTIKDSMSFNIDLGDMGFGGEEYSETIERDFPVGPLPGLHVRNVSGDTKIAEDVAHVEPEIGRAHV